MGENQAAASECIICHQVKEQGMRICGEFICLNCEQEIVNTDVADVRYSVFVEHMKRIWWSATSSF